MILLILLANILLASVLVLLLVLLVLLILLVLLHRVCCILFILFMIFWQGVLVLWVLVSWCSIMVILMSYLDEHDYKTSRSV